MFTARQTVHVPVTNGTCHEYYTYLSEKSFMVVLLSNRKCILLRYFVGKMPPVLACRALSQIPVFCGRSNGRVQHATVYSEGIQGYRCKGKLT